MWGPGPPFCNQPLSLFGTVLRVRKNAIYSLSLLLLRKKKSFRRFLRAPLFIQKMHTCSYKAVKTYQVYHMQGYFGQCQYRVEHISGYEQKSRTSFFVLSLRGHIIYRDFIILRAIKKTPKRGVWDTVVSLCFPCWGWLFLPPPPSQSKKYIFARQHTTTTCSSPPHPLLPKSWL